MEEQRSAAPRKKRKKRGGTKRLVLLGLGTAFAVALVTCVMFFAIFMRYVNTVLEPYLEVDASAYTLNLSSTIYYDDGGEWKELQKVHGVENRTLVEYSEIPDHVWQALVSIEDQRFFEHNGVDWKSTGRAVFNMVTGSGSQRGGSTLTQQVIKNLTGENEATIKRKVTEIFRALRFAEEYSREEVITLYLNLVYFGDGAYGIAAAADTYFGKEVGELTVAEGACIVGITQFPYQYDPSRGDWFREQNKKRQLDVLYKMNEQGYIDDATYEAAKEEPLVFVWDEGYVPSDKKVEEAVESEYNSYIVEQVFKDVVADLMKEKGYSKSVAEDLLYTGGYHIYSTIDPAIQNTVEKVYSNRENLDYYSAKGEPLQSGMTVIDNRTGNIVAMAGRVGEKTGAFDWNYATNARPCGSAIKPLAVYAPALESNAITPATILDDYPVRLQMNENDDLKAWPKNSYTGYKGLITLREAIRVSTNTTAVRVLETIGPSASYAFLTEKLGFGKTLVNDDLNSAALALGGFTYGVSTVEMAAAYSVFANNGVYTRPRTYVEVRDNDGNIVLENKSESWVALKESTVYAMNDLLKNVVRSGTGTEAAFSGMTIAGKTGTTSNNYDRYFAGYTPYYSAAVWIGYDYNTRISASGNPAAQLWKKVMSEVHETLPNADFPTTDTGMTEVTVCAQTGLLPGELCKELYTVKVPEGTAPVLTCDGHIYMSVCTESGCLANEYCPGELVQSVNTIDFASENVVNGMAYAREIILEPPTQKQVAEYEALLAAEPETETAAPTDTVITANDSGASYPDLVALGTCTLHEAPEVIVEVPGFDWGFDFDDGSGLAEEEEEEENAGFLNQLLGII